jgi:hypothetical protein
MLQDIPIHHTLRHANFGQRFLTCAVVNSRQRFLVSFVTLIATSIAPLLGPPGFRRSGTGFERPIVPGISAREFDSLIE